MSTDLRQALRSLVKSPGFSALVIVVLAVGIGANSAIFSIVNGVLFKPLPFADASRLIAIESKARDDDDSASVPDFLDWRSQSKTIDRMAAFAGNGVTMTGRGEAVTLHVALTSFDLFGVLGVQPMLGRALTAADDVKGAEPVAVISESTWTQRFGRAPSIVGEGVMFDGRRFTIVGVMPASFQFPIQIELIDAWLPIGAVPLMGQFMEQRGAHFVKVVGRLAPGATLDQANAELSTIAAQLAKAYPSSNTNRTANAHLLQEQLVREYRAGLIVLLSAVAAVLLIACANVANLLLARGTTRQKELSIRAAMGASRGRLIRQLLAESLLLAFVGGALGIVLALWGVEALVSASPLDIPRLRDVTVDRGVLLFTTLISVVTGVVFGVAPALLLSRADGSETLKDAGRGASAGRSARMRQTLVVAEVALSLVLLAGAGLLVRTLVALQHVDPGFVADHAIGAEVTLPKARYPDLAAQLGFYRRLLEEMRTMPGIVSSGVTTTLPLSGNNLGLGFTIDGRPSDPGHKLSASYFAISPDYFTAMGIRLTKGRAFTERDNQDAPKVVIISETFARKHWPGEDPIGKRVSIGYNNLKALEIVGVVGDVKQGELAETAPPEMYTPFPQTPWPFLSFVVRTVGKASSMAGSMRAMVARLDPDQALGDLKPLAAYVDQSVATPRFTAALVGGFATLALVLAGFGLFSVMAYSVAQRRREIGIRMALGAQASNVRALVVSQAIRLGVVGLVVGLIGAFAATRVLDSLLFGVTATDPVTFGGVCATLVAVLLLAAYLPARRATRVDPMIALRTE
jgi:putative ABC transport system permease protein